MELCRHGTHDTCLEQHILFHPHGWHENISAVLLSAFAPAASLLAEKVLRIETCVVWLDNANIKDVVRKITIRYYLIRSINQGSPR